MSAELNIKQDGENWSISADGLTKMQVDQIAEIFRYDHDIKRIVDKSWIETQLTECIAIWIGGSKLAAVKLFKNITDFGLKDAKEGIESIIYAISGLEEPSKYYARHSAFLKENEDLVVKDWKKMMLVGLPQLTDITLDFVSCLYTEEEFAEYRGGILGRKIGIV